jgi:hypothetical protein
MKLLTATTQQIADGLAHRGNSSLLQLTERSIDENVSIRTITIITLVYLPAQCVAVSLLEPRPPGSDALPVAQVEPDPSFADSAI